MITVLVGLALQVCPADDLYAEYAARDTASLRARLTVGATRAESMLVRYRLYPLTQDASLLADLPDELPGGTAAEHAVASALWGYRVNGAGPLEMMRSGARSQTLLEAGRRLDPADPWVLLVDAQALLYKPRLVGGDPRAAEERLRTLARLIEARAICGLPREEVRLWQWRVAERLERAWADSLRAALLAEAPSPLTRAILDGDW